MLSAVRLSTPPPPDASAPPRKRSLSRSPSPVRRVRDFPLQDVNPNRADERRRQFTDRSIPNGVAATPSKPKTEEEKQAIAKAEYEKLLNVRSGGTYIPPAKLRALQAQITDKTSKEYQRMAWEALKVCYRSKIFCTSMRGLLTCSPRNPSMV
jgi:pre-mRNA-splicing factor CWC22